jgi:KaiC/GvpD/RAD55 family RecA-like ATPase
MSGYTRQQAVLWQHAVTLADRGFRIAMVRLGWDEVRGEKTMLRNPPAGWQLAEPFPSTQVKAKIDEGCNAYLYRLPEGWWVVDADTAELVAEYAGLLGAPDVVTPRGAHWVVDAPAQSRHKLDTGIRGFYGPGSHYLGPDGHLREYTGAVPVAPRPLPPALRRTAAEYGQLAPGEPMALDPGAARHTVEKFRAAWLASVHGGRHVAMRDYLPQLARLLRAEGSGWDEVAERLQQAVEAHPEYDPEWFGTGSATGVLHFALEAAATMPWKLEGPPADTLEGRFTPPDPGEAPVLVDAGDGGELFAGGDPAYFRNPPPPPEPSYGSFGGTLPLFYSDGVHWLQGPSESGKSWVAFAVVLEILRVGGWVLIIDHEDTRGNVLRRLQALGMSEQEYARLVYVSGPDVTHAEVRGHLAATDRDYAAMVVDGVTSALSAAGLSGRDEQETTRWVDQLPRQARMAICIDHMVKAVDDRQGMAIGTQAKKAVVTGSAWEVAALSPIGRGRSGVIELRLQKDKGGFLRGELGKAAVRLDFVSEDGGDRARLTVGAGPSGGFFADPNESLFSALYANGLTASCSADEFAKAARDTGAKVRNNERTRLRDSYMKYWADRENEVRPVDNPVDNFVP